MRGIRYLAALTAGAYAVGRDGVASAACCCSQDNLVWAVGLPVRQGRLQHHAQQVCATSPCDCPCWQHAILLHCCIIFDTEHLSAIRKVQLFVPWKDSKAAHSSLLVSPAHWHVKLTVVHTLVHESPCAGCEMLPAASNAAMAEP